MPRPATHPAAQPPSAPNRKPSPVCRHGLGTPSRTGGWPFPGREHGTQPGELVGQVDGLDGLGGARVPTVARGPGGGNRLMLTGWLEGGDKSVGVGKGQRQ